MDYLLWENISKVSVFMSDILSNTFFSMQTILESNTSIFQVLTV